MVSLFFGLPGAGKTAYLTFRIVNYLMLIDTRSKKCRYENIWTNADVSISHPSLHVVPFSDMVNYDLGERSVLLIDEAQLEFSTREYKTFTKDLLRLFTMHRHYGYDIETYTQRFNALDLNVRTLTVNVYYLRKGGIFRGVTHVYPVSYGIYIPRKKDTDSNDYGEIKQGYWRWSFISALFHPRIVRKPLYGLFESYCRPSLDIHPSLQDHATIGGG